MRHPLTITFSARTIARPDAFRPPAPERLLHRRVKVVVLVCERDLLRGEQLGICAPFPEKAVVPHEVAAPHERTVAHVHVRRTVRHTVAQIAVDRHRRPRKPLSADFRNEDAVRPPVARRLHDDAARAGMRFPAVVLGRGIVHVSTEEPAAPAKVADILAAEHHAPMVRPQAFRETELRALGNNHAIAIERHALLACQQVDAGGDRQLAAPHRTRCLEEAHERLGIVRDPVALRAEVRHAQLRAAGDPTDRCRHDPGNHASRIHASFLSLKVRPLFRTSLSSPRAPSRPW